MFFQKYIPIFLTCFGFIHLSSLSVDPCLMQPCDFGEICERSIDGLSYNCIIENSLHPTQSFNNIPVNYFRKFFEPTPCLSSPCREKQVCRVINVKQYVCVNELELPNDIPNRIQSTAQRSTGFFKALKASRPKNRTQKIDKDEDEDYFMDLKNDENLQEDDVTIELTENKEDDVQPTTDVCINQANGKRFRNPLDTKTYIECQKNVSTIKDCLFNLVFNSHIEKCSKSLEKPKICSPNPCMNGAKCIDMPDSKYKCQCRNGFTGNHCENKDVCPPKACGATGACLSIGFNSPISHLCWCDNGQSFGLDCNKSLETNPCNSIGSKNKKFALKLNPSVYVLCDETKPQIKFCQYPLVFSETTNDCDWAEYRK